jgi:DNA-binding CsgD family transcriptional regulator
MSESTLDRFSDAVEVIYDAAAAPQRWRDALGAVMAMLEGERAALIDVRPDMQDLGGCIAIGYDPAVQKEYAEHYFSVDPEVGLSIAPMVPFSSYEAFDKRTRASSEYFAFARRCGIGDSIQVSTPAIAGRRFLLSVQRNWDAPAFDADEKALLTKLGPHLLRAREVQARLGEAQLGQLEAEAGLDHVATPAFIVDADGRARRQNTAASELLSRCPKLACHGGVLSVADAAVDASFKRAVRAAARPGGQASVLSLHGGQGAGQIDKSELVVAPLQPRAGASWNEPLALVVITQPGDDPETIAWRLRALYGLSAAEARVAAGIALGRTVEEVAAENGVKEVTLRTQLRAVFHKTGTKRQAELVRLALAAGAFRIKP